RRKERTMPREAACQDPPVNELPALLDRELHGLPDRYRAPIVLCDLQGKTRREAARQLGCPEGTVAGRLARGRGLPARRLARHGITVSAPGLAVVCAQSATAAAVPAPLLASTVRAAALGGAVSANVTALIERTLQVMRITTVKTAATCVLACCLLTLS